MYGFSKTVSGNFTEVITKVTQALKEEGFGIISEIDVQTTMKNKLNIEHKPYTILGACNPALAHQAITFEPDIGLLLPCNVVVRENDNAEMVVAFMDPETVLGIIDSDEIKSLGKEVRVKLQNVFNQLS